MSQTLKDREALRRSRVATMVAVLLIHAGFLVLLLLPAGAWRWRASKRATVRMDVLSLRFIAMPPKLPARPRRPAPRRAPAPSHRSGAAASVVAQKRTNRPPAPEHEVPSLRKVTAGNTLGYVPGGGRFAADPGYARDNVHLPGGTQPVHGMPVFRMVDPKMQGIAGAVRRVQRLFGVPDSHCVDVDVWRHMTVAERLAKHIDDARIEQTAADYQCWP
jgi:hypothetical protein